MLYQDKDALKRTKMYANPDVTGVYWKNPEGNIEGYSLEGLVINMDANSFTLADDAQNASSLIPSSGVSLKWDNWELISRLDAREMTLDSTNAIWTIPKLIGEVSFDISSIDSKTITIHGIFNIGGTLSDWKGVITFPQQGLRLEGTPTGFSIYCDSGTPTGTQNLAIGRSDLLNMVLSFSTDDEAKSATIIGTLKGQGEVFNCTYSNINNVDLQSIAFNKKNMSPADGFGDLRFRTFRVWNRLLTDEEISIVLGEVPKPVFKQLEYSFYGKQVYSNTISGTTPATANEKVSILTGVDRLIRRYGGLYTETSADVRPSLATSTFDLVKDNIDSTDLKIQSSSVNTNYDYIPIFTLENDTTVPNVKYNISDVETKTNFTFKGRQVYCKNQKVQVTTAEQYILSGVQELVKFDVNLIPTDTGIVHSYLLNYGEVIQHGSRILVLARNNVSVGLWDITLFYTKSGEQEVIDPQNIDYDISVGVENICEGIYKNKKQVYMQMFEGRLSGYGTVFLIKDFANYSLVSWDGYLPIDNNTYLFFNTDSYSNLRDFFLRQDSTGGQGIHVKGNDYYYANVNYRFIVYYTTETPQPPPPPPPKPVRLDYSYKGKQMYEIEVIDTMPASTTTYPIINTNMDRVCNVMGTCRNSSGLLLTKSSSGNEFSVFKREYGSRLWKENKDIMKYNVFTDYINHKIEVRGTGARLYAKTASMVNQPCHFLVQYTPIVDDTPVMSEFNISETETMTNYTYLGKQVYVKLVNITVANPNTDYPLGIQDIEEVINVELNVQSAINSSIYDNTLNVAFIYVANFQAYCKATSTTFGSNAPFSIVCYYTKASDSPVTVPLSYNIDTNERLVKDREYNKKPIYSKLIQAPIVGTQFILMERDTYSDFVGWQGYGLTPDRIAKIYMSSTSFELPIVEDSQGITWYNASSFNGGTANIILYYTK